MTRRRTLVGTGLAVLVLLAAGALGYVFGRGNDWRARTPNPAPPLQESAAEGRAADAKYFVDEFARLQVDLFKHVDEDDYWASADAIVDGADEMSDEELWLGLYRLTTPMESSHVKADYFGPRLPFELQRFADGFYLAHLPLSLEEHVGARVDAICGVSVADLVDKSGAIIGSENDIYRELRLAQMMQLRTFAETMGCADIESSGLEMTLEGGDTVVVPAAADQVVGQQIRLPVDTADPEALYWYAPVGDSMYLRYRACVEEERFKELMADFWNDVDEMSPDKIVVDVRGNGGGSSRILNNWFIDEAKERDQYLSDGRIVGLIDAGTFSSGVLAGVDLSERVGAPLVGESTGGSISGYGEVAWFRGNNTPIEMVYAKRYVGGDPELNTLRPDKEILLRGVDALEGRDPVLFEVLGVHTVSR